MDKVIKLSRDHPRLRGEHLVGKSICEQFTGSPPPTRGTPGEQLLLNFDTRITPAYAGNTVIVNFFRTEHRDHPRLRGEHFLLFPFVSLLLGSPPPTRGTLKAPVICCISDRITPAYAGNTEQDVF